jgi:hypothetical protein
VISNEKLKERVVNLMIEMLVNYGHPEDKIEEVVLFRENLPYKLFFVDTVKHGYFFVYNGTVDDFWVFEQDSEIKKFMDLFFSLKDSGTSATS